MCSLCFIHHSVTMGNVLIQKESQLVCCLMFLYVSFRLMKCTGKLPSTKTECSITSSLLVFWSMGPKKKMSSSLWLPTRQCLNGFLIVYKIYPRLFSPHFHFSNPVTGFVFQKIATSNFYDSFHLLIFSFRFYIRTGSSIYFAHIYFVCFKIAVIFYPEKLSDFL